MQLTITRSSPVVRTPRVRQLEGMFDVPQSERSELRWEASLPLEERDWQIGLIVGPSGCGKSTLARELFAGAMVEGFDWPQDKSIVDAFPAAMGIKEIVGLLSSVGFSSPPSWLRPFRVLSNGEQFRVTIARALAEKPDLAVIDEFTSVVDRTVARIGSAAIAKAVRRGGRAGGAPSGSSADPPVAHLRRRIVAVSCHYDIIDWLAPDWTFDPSANEFAWRCLPRGTGAAHPPGADGTGLAACTRPRIELEIARVHRAAWKLFQQHHYLNNGLNRAARCFVAFVAGRPAAFTAVLHAPDARGGYWREHRTVCLPDFQGAGIGNALSEFVASLFVAPDSQGRVKRYCSRTSHPAMIRHRAASPLWIMHRAPAFGKRHAGRYAAFNRSAALQRLTAGFRFVGQPNEAAARRLGVVGCHE